jgi:hypothetical protein
MDEDLIAEFETLRAKLDGLYQEALTLSKKNPSDAFNKFKLKITNNVLISTNQLLNRITDALPVEEFEKFDEVSVPVNSDIVFVLAQYLEVFENLRNTQIRPYGDHWYWIIDGSVSSIRTAPPRRAK